MKKAPSSKKLVKDAHGMTCLGLDGFKGEEEKALLCEMAGVSSLSFEDEVEVKLILDIWQGKRDLYRGAAPEPGPDGEKPPDHVAVTPFRFMRLMTKWAKLTQNLTAALNFYISMGTATAHANTVEALRDKDLSRESPYDLAQILKVLGDQNRPGQTAAVQLKVNIQSHSDVAEAKTLVVNFLMQEPKLTDGLAKKLAEAYSGEKGHDVVDGEFVESDDGEADQGTDRAHGVGIDTGASSTGGAGNPES